MLDQGAFDLARVLARAPDFLTDDEHEHNDDVASMSFEVAGPIDPEKFNAWIGACWPRRAQDLLRTKGILSYKGDDRRFAFQAVHMIADGDFIGPVEEGRTAASGWCSSAATSTARSCAAASRPARRRVAGAA